VKRDKFAKQKERRRQERWGAIREGKSDEESIFIEEARDTRNEILRRE
jgi:hypothetical protein